MIVHIQMSLTHRTKLTSFDRGVLEREFRRCSSLLACKCIFDDRVQDVDSDATARRLAVIGCGLSTCLREYTHDRWGQPLAIHNPLRTDPWLINTDPYGNGWMIRVHLEDPSQLDQLMDESSYKSSAVWELA